MQQRIGVNKPRRRVLETLAIGLAVGALGACDSLLEADLPYLLTDAAIDGPQTAETQVNSVQALYECGMSSWGWIAMGHEGIYESIAGVAGGAHIYDAIANEGTCGDADNDQSWFDQIMGARALVSNNPALLDPTGEGRAEGVYDRMQTEWDLGPAEERLSAIAAIYGGASLQHFGEFYCDGALDSSELITAAEFRALAEAWYGRALTHISNFGDFAMPNGAAPSAQLMTQALRAQLRMANGDFAGAATDAQAVLAADPDFTAYVTRELGTTRRNRAFQAGQSARYSGVLGVNDWWNNGLRAPNPATGAQWPAVIPFTGYIFLGIMPDGRTLEAGDIPVRWAEETRDAGGAPVPLANGAVADTRVVTELLNVQGPNPREIPQTYSSDDDDQPLVSWQELTLFLAEWENITNNDQAAAIAHVNTLRTLHSLPTVSGAYLATLTDGTNDQAEVRALIFEEYRRELFGEGMGRIWAFQIRNTDIAWFPRQEGNTPGASGYNLQGGVRLAFPTSEYTGNPKISAAGGEALRGTGCPAAEAPVI